jgi:hypothetical protein
MRKIKLLLFRIISPSRRECKLALLGNRNGELSTNLFTLFYNVVFLLEWILTITIKALASEES